MVSVFVLGRVGFGDEMNIIQAIKDGIHNRQLIKDGKRNPAVKSTGNREMTDREAAWLYSEGTPSGKGEKWYTLASYGDKGAVDSCTRCGRDRYDHLVEDLGHAYE